MCDGAEKIREGGRVDQDIVLGRGVAGHGRGAMGWSGRQNGGG